MFLGRDIKLSDDSAEEEGVSDNWKKRQIYKDIYIYIYVYIYMYIYIYIYTYIYI